MSFRYQDAELPAIRDVAFDLDPGAVLLVVGPSGSGKSTLARAIAGLIPREFPGDWRGSLRVGELDATAAVASPAAASALVGIVFQDPASQLVMDRVADDVAFGLENRGWPLEAMRARVPEAMATVGLAGYEERRSGRLSGGEQQRLVIAGVLAPQPTVLVLDEPTANLDPDGAAAVFGHLAELRRRGATTIVLVEHRVELAWPLADMVLALGQDGSPIDVGAPSDVLARSSERLVAAGIWLPELDTRSSRSTGVPPTGAVAWNGVAGDSILELQAVRYTFDHTTPAVRQVDLAITAGERVALVGPNGSGKTTLLRLSAGLLRPQAGTVRITGRDPFRLSAQRLAALVGFVHQDPELGFLADTVAEEVALGLRPAAAAHGAALADRLALPLHRFGSRNPYSLSGGEQRRLSLIAALTRAPALLLLDEPTYGQDRHGHEALVRILDEVVAEGRAVLAATHDERFVRDAATRRVELNDGWVDADGPIQGSGPS
ncbi:MAG TPA: ATP-binding cassette domain-containing protein [Candidatus Eisenbacteria bacterium]|nr:ATP-binding cassette domain-containing protein [Candidatus Eisenbacteria bacterium]